jgi:hypothetical protein
MPETRTILVDGLQVVTTDAGAAAIEKLQNQLKAVNDSLTKKEAEVATLTTTHTDAIVKKDAEIATLKASVVTGDALDKMIVARGKLIGDAKRIVADVATDGKSDAEIRKATVTKKLGDAACAGKEQPFFDHVFDGLVAQLPAQDQQTGSDNFVRAVSDQRTTVSATDADKAREKAEEEERNAWKKKAA